MKIDFKPKDKPTKNSELVPPQNPLSSMSGKFLDSSLDEAAKIFCEFRLSTKKLGIKSIPYYALQKCMDKVISNYNSVIYQLKNNRDICIYNCTVDYHVSDIKNVDKREAECISQCNYLENYYTRKVRKYFVKGLIKRLRNIY